MQLLLARQPQIVVEGRAPVALAARDAALLAWLALEGPTPRLRLAGLLWPDSDPQTARNALRQRLFQLRRQLGADPVHGSATLRLAEGVTHDLVDADSVLGDTRHEYSAEIDGWLALRREHGAQRQRRALADLEDAAEQAGDYAGALDHAQELLGLEPLSEDAHRRVIRLHYLRGDRAAALLAFDRCEHMLKDEIGARPSGETLALLATIERSAPVASRTPRTAVPAAVLRPPRLIGRDAQIRQLSRAFDDHAVVLLAGEAGMGKSRLLAELAASSDNAAPALLVTGARPGDSIVPHALAARWLRALLARPGVSVDAAQRSALSRVLPELGGAATPRHDDRERAVAAIDALVEQARRAGLRATAIDDLQFADEASIALLGACMGSAACGWIVAMRPDELGPAARALVDALAASGRTVDASLAALDAPQVAALLDSLAIEGIGGIAQAEALCRHTGGNPLFLLETLKAAIVGNAATQVPAVRDDGAPIAWPRAQTVTHLIQQRLARLSPLALKLARCAAVAGPDLSSPLAAQVLGLRPLDLADAWSELDAAQVLRDGAFAHDLIAEAALASVPPPIARPLHAEVASFLEANGGAPARVAEHWLAAGEPLKAAPQLLRAARQASLAWQMDESSRLHERAATLLLAAGERRGAFDAYFAAVRDAGNVATNARVEALTQTLDELAEGDAQRATAALARISLLFDARRYDDARRCALEALPRAQAAGLHDVQAELLYALVALHWDRREIADALRCAEQALALIARADAATARVDLRDTQFKLTHGIGMILQSVGRRTEAIARLEEAAQTARSTGQTAAALQLADTLCGAALEQGDAESARRWEQAIARDVDHEGIGPPLRIHALVRSSIALATTGDLARALAAADRSVEQAQRDYPRYRADALRWRAWLHFELGRRDLALKALRTLQGDTDLLAVERVLVEATLLHIGEGGDAASVVEQAAALEDFTTRVRALCLAARGCEPARILPLLGMSASAARDQAAYGLWLPLQTARVAALRACGRAAEAARIAHAAWERLAAGTVGVEPFPRSAAELCAALVDEDPHLAETIALTASAWRQRAAATLPSAWRESYLSRAPSSRDLPAPAARWLAWSPP